MEEKQEKQEVQIVEVGERVIAAVRVTTEWRELATTIRRSFDEVYAYIKQAGVTQSGHNIVVYLDDKPTIEVGVEVSARFESEGRVRCAATPAGLAATMAHWGAYSELGRTYDAIVRFCKANDWALVRPSWEIYGDWSDDPAKLRTDVYYGVASQAST